MTRNQAHRIAKAILDHMPHDMAWRVKSIDVCPKLHQGMLTIRVYMKNVTAEDPEPFIFPVEEI